MFFSHIWGTLEGTSFVFLHMGHFRGHFIKFYIYIVCISSHFFFHLKCSHQGTSSHFSTVRTPQRALYHISSTIGGPKKALSQCFLNPQPSLSNAPAGISTCMHIFICKFSLALEIAIWCTRFQEKISQKDIDNKSFLCSVPNITHLYIYTFTVSRCEDSASGSIQCNNCFTLCSSLMGSVSYCFQ